MEAIFFRGKKLLSFITALVMTNASITVNMMKMDRHGLCDVKWTDIFRLQTSLFNKAYGQEDIYG